MNEIDISVDLLRRVWLEQGEQAERYIKECLSVLYVSHSLHVPTPLEQELKDYFDEQLEQQKREKYFTNITDLKIKVISKSGDIYYLSPEGISKDKYEANYFEPTKDKMIGFGIAGVTSLLAIAAAITLVASVIIFPSLIISGVCAAILLLSPVVVAMTSNFFLDGEMSKRNSRIFTISSFLQSQGQNLTRSEDTSPPAAVVTPESRTVDKEVQFIAPDPLQPGNN